MASSWKGPSSPLLIFHRSPSRGLRSALVPVSRTEGQVPGNRSSVILKDTSWQPQETILLEGCRPPASPASAEVFLAAPLNSGSERCHHS